MGLGPAVGAAVASKWRRSPEAASHRKNENCRREEAERTPFESEYHYLSVLGFSIDLSF